jgi:cell division protease FtsH
MAADDDSFMTKSRALAQLTVAMGGRAAEEILLDGDFTQGASGDLASATSLALRMVAQWGMSSLGLATVHPEMTGAAPSEKVLEEVDRLLGEALENARRLVREHSDFMSAIVKELLEEETIDLDGIQALHARVAGTVAA